MDSTREQRSEVIWKALGTGGPNALDRLTTDTFNDLYAAVNDTYIPTEIGRHLRVVIYRDAQTYIRLLCRYLPAFIQDTNNTGYIVPSVIMDAVDPDHNALQLTVDEMRDHLGTAHALAAISSLVEEVNSEADAREALDEHYDIVEAFEKAGDKVEELHRYVLARGISFDGRIWDEFNSSSKAFAGGVL